MDELTQRVITIIEASPLSQRAISIRAGQRPTWLSDLLQGWRGRGRRGQEPTISALQLLAQGLGVELEVRLGEERISGGATSEIARDPA